MISCHHNHILAVNYVVATLLMMLLTATATANVVVIRHTRRTNNVASTFMQHKAILDFTYAFILTIKLLFSLLISYDPTQLFSYSIPQLDVVNATYTIFLFRNVTLFDEVMAFLCYLCQGFLIMNCCYLVITPCNKNSKSVSLF